MRRIELLSLHESSPKIQAIKSFRALTGMGLKEAKDVIDGVAAGRPYSCAVDADGVATAMRTLGETMNVRLAPQDLPLDEIVAFLSHYPADMTVGQIYAVLHPTLSALNAP